MRYLILITRTIRAERPSEAMLNPSFTVDIAGQQIPYYLTQNPAVDTFIQKRSNRQPEMVLSEILAQELMSPLKRTQLDGVAIIQYPHGNKLTGATELQEGGVAQVQYITENSNGENEYQSLQEALDFISTLHASDGYILIDHKTDGTNTEVIDSRPSLWNLDEYNTLVTVPNLHQRVDNDRV